jgi:hypothetical protein
MITGRSAELKAIVSRCNLEPANNAIECHPHLSRGLRSARAQGKITPAGLAS